MVIAQAGSAVRPDTVLASAEGEIDLVVAALGAIVHAATTSYVAETQLALRAGERSVARMIEACETIFKAPSSVRERTETVRALSNTLDSLSKLERLETAAFDEISVFARESVSRLKVALGDVDDVDRTPIAPENLLIAFGAFVTANSAFDTALGSLAKVVADTPHKDADVSVAVRAADGSVTRLVAASYGVYDLPISGEQLAQMSRALARAVERLNVLGLSVSNNPQLASVESFVEKSVASVQELRGQGRVSQPEGRRAVSKTAPSEMSATTAAAPAHDEHEELTGALRVLSTGAVAAEQELEHAVGTFLEEAGAAATAGTTRDAEIIPEVGISADVAAYTHEQSVAAHAADGSEEPIDAIEHGIERALHAVVDAAVDAEQKVAGAVARSARAVAHVATDVAAASERMAEDMLLGVDDDRSTSPA